MGKKIKKENFFWEVFNVCGPSLNEEEKKWDQSERKSESGGFFWRKIMTEAEIESLQTGDFWDLLISCGSFDSEIRRRAESFMHISPALRRR